MTKIKGAYMLRMRVFAQMVTYVYYVYGFYFRSLHLTDVQPTYGVHGLPEIMYLPPQQHNHTKLYYLFVPLLWVIHTPYYKTINEACLLN